MPTGELPEQLLAATIQSGWVSRAIGSYFPTSVKRYGCGESDVIAEDCGIATLILNRGLRGWLG